ncbi:hypothetical protein OJ996_20130 [Luteolibacter sp. GHJ8]|uniref:Uncharacterized protein n=1 Tax=Luteolibacter rhizosphaerae TaxID=2989719 RepID=A0ABT3G7S3_9BACT|nr:hypothetical protein [Luteolibacter rhizosphaerae]MCW1915907.1 hypothetical protein [Luteolibacter rhizosphaerae]
MNLAAYQRLIVGYHGCDASVAKKAIEKGEALLPSEKDYDWLGSEIYFWEHGPDRALAWAKQRCSQGKLKNPAVVGALIQLGNCFDLLDTRYTGILAPAFEELQKRLKFDGRDLPRNHGGDDLLRRDRDCMLLNWLLPQLEKEAGSQRFQTVRGMFQEGGAAFEGSGIRFKSHIQIAVRDPSCIIGYFRPA